METKKVSFLGSRPEHQEYSNKDISLIEQKIINPSFTLFSNDYIEYFIYDSANTLLASNYTAHSYKPVDVNSTNNSTNTLQLNPEEDIARFGIDRGSVNVTYNFYTNLFSSNFDNRFWIADISDNRTEIRVVRNDISNTELQKEFNQYQQKVFALPYYPDFLLNFGENRSLIGVNLLYASSGQQASLLIKLYEPLPDDIDIKDTFWMVHKLAEPVSFNVDISLPQEIPSSSLNLRGPNFNINLKKSAGQTTNLYNYNTLFGIGLPSGSATTSSFNRLKSLLEEKSIDINVDYSDFSNFVHFSSAVERISNFVYKLGLIEDAQSNIITTSNISGSVASSSVVTYNNIISNITEKFDEYEYYLYFNSGSDNSYSPTWPKYTSGSTLIPYSVTSSQAIQWIGSTESENFTGRNMLWSASIYDLNNPDYLINTLPLYIREDAENNPAFIFTSMLGHHFDNLYVYYKDVTNKYKADSDINYGVSKDLVADALRSLGIKLYTNTNNADNLYYTLFGVEPDGNNNASSFPTGSEVINFPINYGETQSTSPQDIQTEIYKRIYHNLPFLLKTKGTERGLRALIACYGIPDTILRINEFGGSNKDNKYSSYLTKNQYSALATYPLSGTLNVSKDVPALIMPWGPVALDYLEEGAIKVPDVVQFRFNSTKGHPTSSYGTSSWGDTTYVSRTSIFHVNTGSATQFGVQLEYLSSTDAAYSPLSSSDFATQAYNYPANTTVGIAGSAISGSEFENHAYMRLWLSGSNGYKTSSYIYLPFYDPQYWWNMYIYRETSSYVENFNYNQYVRPYESIAGLTASFSGSYYYNTASNEYLGVTMSFSGGMILPTSSYAFSYVNRIGSSSIGFSGSTYVLAGQTNNRYWIYTEAELYNAQGVATPGFKGSASIDIIGAASDPSIASYNFAWNKNNSGSLGSVSTGSAFDTINDFQTVPTGTYIADYTSSFRGKYYLSETASAYVIYASGTIIPSNSYAYEYYTGSSTASGFAGTVSYREYAVTRSYGGLFAGYLGGNMIGSSDFASASYQGQYHDFKYWRKALHVDPIQQQNYSPNIIAGNTITSSIYDLLIMLPLGVDTSNSSSYFGTDLQGNKATQNSFDQSDKQNLGLGIINTSPASTGSYIIRNGSKLTTIPAFFVFDVSGSPVQINGGAYSSSLFATNYTYFDRYDMMGSLRGGLEQRVTNKVTVLEPETISGSVLSPYVSIEKLDDTETKTSPNIEVAFSPSDQIDDDINYQFGYLDLDNYVGSPEDRYKDTYQDLNELSKLYFTKYTKAYNVWDFVRLVKFYDNSLFKMIKDFVPAKARLASGVVIKPHALNRSTIKRHEPGVSFVQLSGSVGGTGSITKVEGNWALGTEYSSTPSGSYTTGSITGSVGTFTASIISGTTTTYAITGSTITAFTQSYTYTASISKTYYKETIQGLTGSIDQEYTDNAALFTGRFGGTTITHSRDFNQTEYSRLSNTYSASLFISYSVSNSIDITHSWIQDYSTFKLNPLFNNVTESRRSTTKLDLDYAYSANVPVNLDVVRGFYEVVISGSGSPVTSGFWPYAQIQDSDYYLTSFRLPRYFGSKNSSSLFNTYSLIDDQIDDIYNAYGKTSPINNYTRKIGLFTQIASSSFLHNKNNASMLYLVDKSGSFVSLNKENKNWIELQNTFKQSEKATVKLFDNQKYADQRSTDGSKVVDISGYSYQPMLYFNQGGPSVEAGTNINSGSYDPVLYFTNTEYTTPRIFTAQNLQGTSGSIGTGILDYYQLTTSGSFRAIYNAFSYETSPNDLHLYYTGSAAAERNPQFKVPANAVYNFTGSVDIALTSSIEGQSITYTMQIVRTAPSYSVVAQSTSSYTNPGAYIYLTHNKRTYIETTRAYDTASTSYATTPITLRVRDTAGTVIETIPSGSYLYFATGSTTLTTTNGTVGKDQHILYAFSTGYNPSLLNPANANISGSSYSSHAFRFPAMTASYFDDPIIWAQGYSVLGGGTYTQKLFDKFTTDLNIKVETGDRNFITGSIIEFRLIESSSISSNYTASFGTPGTLGVVQKETTTGVYPYAYNVWKDYTLRTETGSYYYQSGSSLVPEVSWSWFTGSYVINVTQSYADGYTGSFESSSIGLYILPFTGSNTIRLNKNLSSLYGYQFVPDFASGSYVSDKNGQRVFQGYQSSSLYSKYGDVNYPFLPKQNDVVVLGEGGLTQEFRILNTYFSESYMHVEVYPNITDTFFKKMPTTASFLSRVQDETNVVLEFSKRAGYTSYGLLIPDNIAPDILDNIDTITKEIYQKLGDMGLLRAEAAAMQPTETPTPTPTPTPTMTTTPTPTPTPQNPLIIVQQGYNP